MKKGWTPGVPLECIEVDPHQLGWKRDLSDPEGRAWITDKGERHLFPTGEKEVLVVRIGRP